MRRLTLTAPSGNKMCMKEPNKGARLSMPWRMYLEEDCCEGRVHMISVGVLILKLRILWQTDQRAM
jgi:hypothetical protein